MKGTPIARALSVFLFLTLGTLGVLLILLVHVSGSRLIHRSLDDFRQDEMQEISGAIEAFVQNQIRVLHDTAGFPLISQAVMQPEESYANIVDFMDALSLLGNRPQIVLLDYSGRIIHATHHEPIFDYAKESWMPRLIEGTQDEHRGISHFSDAYYWRLAVPVLYNGYPEGVLVAEIPIKQIELEPDFTAILAGGQAQLIQEDAIVATFGDDADAAWEEYALPDLGIRMRLRIDTSRVVQQYGDIIVRLIVLLAGLTLIVIVVALLLGKRFFAIPLEQLRSLTSSAEQGTLVESTIPIKHRIREVSLLARDFSTMVETVRAREQALRKQSADLEFANNELEEEISERRRLESELVHAQKMESIGQLAAGIAHEINTPIQYVSDNIRFLSTSINDLLGLMKGYQGLMAGCKKGPCACLTDASSLEDDADLPYLLQEIPKAIDQGLEGTARVSKIVRAMKGFSHPGTEEMALTNLNEAIETTITVSRNEWKYVAEMETELDPALPQVPCLVGEFNQVILNLIVNAAHAIGEVVGKDEIRKGKITVRTSQDGDFVLVQVADTGPGIPEAHRSRIFEPFFTTKEVGKGTGQGLAIAHSVIVDKHHGSIALETEMGKGTTFNIRLPLNPPDAPEKGDF